MASLKQKISEDLKAAMKEGDTVKRDVLRMLESAMRNSEIEKKKRESGLDNEEVREVISRAIKQRKDSFAQYLSGGRADLAEKEKAEIEILSIYMPDQMSEAEVEKVVKELISKTPSVSVSDMGKIMGMAMGKLKGKADGNLVRGIVEKELKAKNEN